MNAYSLDFIKDYEGQEIKYLDDLFREFADNNVNIYYSDQFKYYEEHEQECENALIEYYGDQEIAVLLKHDTLYQLCCKAGMLGEYNAILNELYEDEEEIKEALGVE